MKKLICAAVAAVALLAGGQPALAQAILPPQPPKWVADAGQMFAPEDVSAMESTISTFKGTSGCQIVVLTLQSANGESAHDVCVRALNGWNPGKRSVMIFATASDRLLAIQPGTDLKFVFDEPTSRAIWQNQMVPHMKAGRRAQAFQAAIASVMGTLTSAESAGRAQTQAPVPAYRHLAWYERWTALDWFWAAVVVLVVLVFLYALISSSSRRSYGRSYYGGGGYSETNVWLGGNSGSSSSSYDSGSSSSSYDSGSSGSFSGGDGGSCDGGGGSSGSY